MVGTVAQVVPNGNRAFEKQKTEDRKLSFEDCRNITRLSDETYIVQNYLRKALQMKRKENRRGILSQVKVDQELIVENKDKLLDKHMAKELGKQQKHCNGAVEKSRGWRNTL